MVVGTPQKDSWEAQMGSAFRRLNLRQILFTLAMLSLFQLGQYIPLPGISLETIANLVDSGGMDRISILALGIVPWVSAAIIVFAAGLIVPAISRSCFRNHHVNIYHPLVILLAILIAIPQAYGIHVGLQAASGIIDPQAGSFNSYAIIASLIGGVAISIFIANMIDTHGTGLGIWLLMGLPFLSGILDNFSMLIELSRQGVMPLLPFFLIDLGYLVFVILACCLLVLLLRPLSI